MEPPGSAPVDVSFSQPGYQPWHLDVIYVPSKGEYWALVAAYATYVGCTETVLFFASSPMASTGQLTAGRPEPGNGLGQKQIYAPPCSTIKLVTCSGLVLG